MKNILLLVHDDPGQEARLQAALDIARALGGHLTCLAVTIMPVATGELYAASMEAELLADEGERQAANKARLQARLEKEDVPWNWVDAIGNLADALDQAAKTADLVVVNRRLDSTAFPDMRAVAAEVIVGSGRAVVAVPEGARGFETAGRALVAWDGSDEAMTALQAATPMLKLARNVAILEVDDGTIETPAEEAAAYLSRHGIHADLVRKSGRVQAVSEAILARAKAFGADYVVMGGFGHARLVEALFGGVSRDMLSDSPVPTFIAH